MFIRPIGRSSERFRGNPAHFRIHYSEFNLRRLPSFCAAFLGALTSIAGIIAVILSLNSANTHNEGVPRASAFIILGVGVSLMLIGFICQFVLYKEMQHKKRTQKERRQRKEAQLQMKYAPPYTIYPGVYDDTGSTAENEAGAQVRPGWCEEIVQPPPYEEESSQPPPYQAWNEVRE